MMGELEGRVAIVTGSTSGIGAEVARQLAAVGAHVVVNSSKSVDAGRALAEALPTECIYVQADISDEAQDQAMVAEVVDRFGRLDMLVNNAGWTSRVAHADLDGLTEEILRRTFEVNVFGTWWLTRAAMPHLRESPAGSVVNVTSIAGLRPHGSSVAYGMSKAALNHLTIDLAKHCAPVRLNAVAPGLVETPWIDAWPDQREQLAAATPTGRIATPDDCAQVVMMCLTNTQLNGAVIVVDGGYTVVT
jgi:ketoreductase RED2